MINIQNITKRFNRVTAVDDLCIDIPRGQITGFLGPNGAGKTTTIRIITGFIEPDSGSVLIDGEANNKASINKKIGYLPENNPLYGEMLVSEWLYYSARLCEVPKNMLKEAVDKAVYETEISSVFYRPISELSKGFRQRTGLAAAIIHDPDILILDEPTEGLDPNQRTEIRDLIKGLGKEKTIILSSHVLQEVETTCDRVVIMNYGKMIADKLVADILGDTNRKVITAELSGDISIDKIMAIEGVADVVKMPSDGLGISNVTKIKITANSDKDIRPELFELSKENNWSLVDLHLEKTNLETVFKELTAGKADE